MITAPYVFQLFQSSTWPLERNRETLVALLSVTYVRSGPPHRCDSRNSTRTDAVSL